MLVTDSPLISIIVPAYNAERFLQRTVASVLAQLMTRWEMIIVDDGATDGTPALADALAQIDPRIRVVHQRNGGLSNARNNGAAATEVGVPYLIFLDADDLWLPETLGTLLFELERHPEWGGVYVLGEYIDEHDQSIRSGELEAWCSNRLRVSEDHSHRQSIPADSATEFEMISMRNYVPSSGAMLLRREAFAQAGGFKEDLRSLEDWHQWVRMSLRKPFGYIPKILYRYRRHGSNMSSDEWRMRRETYRAARDIAKHCAMTPTQSAHFQRSQTVLTHLYWARDDAKGRQFASAAWHFSTALRNAFDYTARPKLAKLLGLQR